MAKEEHFYRLWLSSQWEKKNKNEEWNQWRREHLEEEIDLRQANLLGRDLSGANLQGADLEEAVLSGVSLVEADLRGANLKRAHLQSADLSKAKVKGAVFEGAALTDTLWHGVEDVTAEQLKEAKDLEGAQGLSEKIWQELEEIAPHLVSWRKKEVSG